MAEGDLIFHSTMISIGFWVTGLPSDQPICYPVRIRPPPTTPIRLLFNKTITAKSLWRRRGRTRIAAHPTCRIRKMRTVVTEWRLQKGEGVMQMTKQCLVHHQECLKTLLHLVHHHPRHKQLWQQQSLQHQQWQQHPQQ